MEQNQPFDPQVTLEENFPIITRADKYDFNLDQCSINLKDKESPFKYSEAKQQYEHFWRYECHQVQYLLVEHIREMCEKGLLQDDEGNTLTKDSEQVKEFFDSDAVKFTIQDEGLFSYLYENIAEMQNCDQVHDPDDDDGEENELENGWIKYYDEEDKKVYYKQEDGLQYGTVMLDCVTDAALCETVACYENLEVLEDLMKEFYDLKWVKKRGKGNGLIYGKQSFPWPMWHRDITMYASGVFDFKNKGVITISKSLEPGTSYYGVKVPDVDEANYVRMEIKQGYNFFQYLGPRKTRHIQIMNTDPILDYMPTFFLNYMMTSVLYANIKGLQDTSEAMHDPDFKHYNLMESKKDFYAYVLEDVTTGGVNVKEEMYKKYGLEPLDYGPFDAPEEEEQEQEFVIQQF